MSETLIRLNQIGFRTEADPNIGQNPEMLGGIDITPESTLRVVRALRQSLESRNDTPQIEGLDSQPLIDQGAHAGGKVPCQYPACQSGGKVCTNVC